MGSTAGANTAQASVSGATGSPVTFTATAVADVPPPMNAAVTVVDDSFDPDQRTIAAGGTVTWTWSGTTNQHNVTFASGTNSATQAAGTFMRTFAATGSFPYQCTIHGASMSGTIIVE
jgi:plastocyanin